MTEVMTDRYAERTYAGVLGKIIGVYLGRPVEGWRYSDLRKRFGDLSYYVNAQLGEPIVVADDDVSGTFAFARALADNDYPAVLEARQVGDTWLNYIIENRTILWWGGLGRSTEHTAFLRLKAGIAAPASGSMALNGPTLPEQVGAQIFSDAFAMAFPGDPERAAAAVRAAASVSHDGVALEAAAFLAAMRALAFDVHDLHELIARCRGHLQDERLVGAVDAVLAICAKQSGQASQANQANALGQATELDWREVRDWIDRELGYALFDGPCHIIPNHAMTLAALLLGGDNFQRSIMIAASAGFDTDSNAGVVGCLNGIRLGLDAVTAQVDFRAEVADRLLVVTADGGSCISDAVQETRRIVRAATVLRNDPMPPPAPRFGFEFRGSRQGFVPCPVVTEPDPSLPVTNMSVRNGSETGHGPALVLRCPSVGPGVSAAVSTPVFLDPAERADNFSTVASPTLYPGQTVRMTVSHDSPTVTGGTWDGPRLRMYVLHRRPGGAIDRTESSPFDLSRQASELCWQIPDVGPTPLLRFGLRLEGDQHCDTTVVVREIDWRGAPERFAIDGVLQTSIWDTHPEPLNAWVSSAANFEADFDRTFCVSHPHGIGLATIGSVDWDDYAVTSTLSVSLHRQAGIVVRSVGHRRYYAAVFADGNRVRLVKQRDAVCSVLVESEFIYGYDIPYRVELRCIADRLVVHIDGVEVGQAVDVDRPYRCGAAGFLIVGGTVLADGFEVRRMSESEAS